MIVGVGIGGDIITESQGKGIKYDCRVVSEMAPGLSVVSYLLWSQFADFDKGVE